MNHYATSMFRDKAGRHYWFAKKLEERGNEVTIFCASTFLNNSDSIDMCGKKVYPAEVESIILQMDGVVDVSVIGEKNQYWKIS